MKSPVERPGFLFVGFRLRVPPRNAGPQGDDATFQPDSANGRMRNGVGSITDLNVLSTQLLQAKKASTDVYSTALAGGGLSGVGDRLSPP